MLIHIHQDTRQKEFLEKLSQIENHGGDLFISVISLPIYLSTRIAFNIFSYRLRKYPRKIIWVSEELHILEMLKESDLHVDINYFNTATDNTSADSINSNANTEQNPQLALEKNPPVILTLDDNYSTEELINQFGNMELSVEELRDSAEYIESPSQFVDEPSVNSVFADTGENQPSTDKYDVTNLQNLDSWLKRVEATKIALDSIRGEDVSRIFGVNEFFSKKNLNPNSVISRVKSQKPKSSSFLSIFFASSVFIILLLVLFPTNVYTLEVVPQEIESSINLAIDTSSFSKKTVKIAETASKQATGADKNTTERATGKIKLVNNSLDSVKINSQNFYAEKGAYRYYYTVNDTVNSEITIPPNTELAENQSIISVQADGVGSEYNIAQNERLEVYNQLEQRICDNCFAVTTEPIQGKVLQGGRVVTSQDQELLRSTIEGLLANKRLNEVENLKNDAVFTDLSWYRNLDSVFTYNKPLGEVATDLELKVDVTTSIYYLPKSTIEEILKSENSEIFDLKKIQLKQSTGNFVQDGEKISLEFLYSYTKNSNLNESQIRKELINSEVDTVNNIQTNYPNIRRIQRKNVGLSIPFIPRRVDINIVESK